MSAVSLHLKKFKSPRPETIQALAKQDDMTAALRAEVARANRQKRLDRIKRVFLWPSYVWRW